MKTISQRILILIMLLAFLQGCSATQHARVDNIVQPMSETWLTVQEVPLSLYDAGLISAADWQNIKKMQKRGAQLMEEIWDVWEAERTLDSKKYIELLGIISDINKTAGGGKSQ